MIAKNALYSFVESLIDNSGPNTPLDGAVSFRNLRSSVDESTKIIRVECPAGQFVLTEQDSRKEANVLFTIQCWVTPDLNRYNDDESAIDAATDDSFEMARTIFEQIATEANLNGTICDVYGDDWESGEGSMGGTRRGVTYFDGIINAATT